MGICEDAPCCGCCGAAVWAAEDRAAEDRWYGCGDYYDRYDEYEDDYDEDDDIEDEDE